MDARFEQRYQDLCRAITDAGLYRRRYGYYACLALVIVAGYAASFYVLTVTDEMFLQLLNALFLSFMTVQAGMLGHDLAHEQVFESTRANHWTGVFVWGLLCGFSESDWYRIHNAHHTHVNQLEHDPDIDIPFYFAKEQIPARMGVIGRTLFPYQHILFFAVLPLLYITKTISTWRRAFSNFGLRHGFELFLALLRWGLLLFLVFHFLPLVVASVFLATYVAGVGIYMSLVFAPNHKGEELIAAHQEVTWLNQITSTRNIHPSGFIFVVFGGLNFQIEHHLFSDMPRPNYRKAYGMVKKFCAENGISYSESGWFGSLREMYVALKKTARP